MLNRLKRLASELGSATPTRLAVCTLGLVTSLYFAALVIASLAKGAERAPALTVIVTTVSQRPLSTVITATGNVVAWREMPVSTEASGLAITELTVDEGDHVTKGQVMAHLNTSILRAQIDQQKAVIQELEATLRTAQSDVRRAQSVSSGVITAQTTEQRETLVQTTTAKIAAAQASLAESEARLRQTEIKAPADGIVASRSVALGQIVQSGTEMFRLIQDSRIEVDALVPEAQINGIEVGHAVTVTAPDASVQKGRVRQVSPLVDAKTRLGTVHVALPEGTKMKPGMFARVEIETASKPTLAIPLKALTWRNAKPNVLKIGKDDVAVLTDVEIGRKTSDFVEILKGLEGDEQIVVEGAGLVNDGERVRVEVAASAKDSIQ